ncbi:MAG: hypothetical protein JXJ04_00250 [Spirochaetales bacterium]|nr:hypothetical protein [Spirochaetales bacterium]
MKKSIKMLLKEIYIDEVDKIDVPAYPFKNMTISAIDKPLKQTIERTRVKNKALFRKMVRKMLFKAAGIIIILGVLGFLLATSKPGQLAVNISELSEKYRLSERIPAGIQYIQKMYQDSNNLKI